MARTNDAVYLRKREQLKRPPGGGPPICVLCGKPIDITLTQYDPQAFWADHVESVAAGGDNRGPLQPMHRLCNQLKGTKPWDSVRHDPHSRRHY